MKIREIDCVHKADINIPNEPFELIGRMIPTYVNEQWGYQTVLFEPENVSKMCFPNEDYDYEAMKRRPCVFGRV